MASEEWYHNMICRRCRRFSFSEEFFERACSFCGSRFVSQPEGEPSKVDQAFVNDLLDTPMGYLRVTWGYAHVGQVDPHTWRAIYENAMQGYTMAQVLVAARFGIGEDAANVLIRALDDLEEGEVDKALPPLRSLLGRGKMRDLAFTDGVIRHTIDNVGVPSADGGMEQSEAAANSPQDTSTKLEADSKDGRVLRELIGLLDMDEKSEGLQTVYYRARAIARDAWNTYIEKQPALNIEDGKVACPHCSSSEVQYVEEVLHWKDVFLSEEGEPAAYPGPDCGVEGEFVRLECSDCGADIPVPCGMRGVY